MATSFSYNGIVLTDIKTNRLEAASEWSQDGIDYLYTKFTVHVRGVLNAALTPALFGETPADTYARIVKCLQKPRGPLALVDDQVTVLSSPPPNTIQDAKGGPFPGAFTVTQMTTSTYIVEFQI